MLYSRCNTWRGKGGATVDQRIINLYDQYVHGGMERRSFLEQLTQLTGSSAAAAALLPLLQNDYAKAQTILENDNRLVTSRAEYQAAGAKVTGYLARLKGGQKRPAVIVIHENRGLNPHTEDVARRLAAEGYWAIAPDALSTLGGTPSNPDEIRPLFQKLEAKANIKNFVAAVQYLKTNPQSTGKVGCMGFCWGGGVTNQVAVNSPDLAAAVPFYGAQPAAEDVPKIKSAMLIHYAGQDERINAGIPAFEAALKKAAIDYKIFMYEGAQHGFFNDSNAARYHKEAAPLAWQRTLEFFKTRLKTG